MAINSFIESPRFNDNISYGSQGGPKFKTFVFESTSGTEQRNITWANARGEWNVSHGVRDAQDMDEIRSFFFNVRGKAVGFRFKDWSDYSVTNNLLGIGDSADSGVTGTAIFNIVKDYTVGVETYSRRIFKPIDGTLALTVDGNLQSEGSDFNIDYTTGIITFTNGNRPETGEEVRVTCEFDVPVRFDTDHLSAAHDGFRTESWSSIPIVELLTGL